MGIVFAQVRPMRFVRGTRWTDEVQLVDQETRQPVNLAGITALVLCIRRSINAPVLLQLSIDDGLTLLNPTSGLIGIDVGSARTLTLPENGNRKAKYVYDALIERAGEYEPAVAGKLTVLPSNTRPWEPT